MKTSNKILFFQLATFILFAIGFMVFLGNNLEPNPWKQDITYSVELLDEIQMSGPMSLEISPGNKNFVTINASDPIDEIAKVDFDSSLLMIHTDGEQRKSNEYHYERLQAYVEVETLNKLKGGGRSWGKVSKLKEAKLEVFAKDNFSFRTYDVDMDTLSLNMEDFSRAKLKGEINVLILNAQDSTNINVEELRVDEIIVNLKGGATLELGDLDKISGTVSNKNAIKFPEVHNIKTTLEVVE